MSDYKLSPDFEEKIKTYINNNKLQLIILTPCFGDICHVGYITSLLNTMFVFKKLNIPIYVEFCRNDSLVTRARNNLIAKAMSNEDNTHFLFIDNDIQWEVEDIIKLICHDAQLIGGVYPIKKYNWNKLVKPDSKTNNLDFVEKSINHKNNSVLHNTNNENYIRYNLVNYNLNYLNEKLSINHNTAKVKHVATGFMLIKRKTIELMFVKYSSTKYTDDVNFLKTEKENKYAYALFDCRIENNSYHSEDWVFCDRWRKMGGEVLIDVSINLTHTGIEDYKGSYMSSVV
tara:strand:- start:15529 stop:16389 length:861 start_codon:yes stop_codon:yes gene_type:complete